jgi:hypothetical protein
MNIVRRLRVIICKDWPPRPPKLRKKILALASERGRNAIYLQIDVDAWFSGGQTLQNALNYL